MAGNLDFRLNLLANTTGLQQGMNGAKFAVNALVAAMAAVGIGASVSGLVAATDSYTNLSARINIATKDGGDFTSAMAGVHLVALQTNSSLQATGDLFTRLNTVGKEMGMTQQQALDLTKTVTQAIQIGGGSAQASEAAVTQFIQAMQGGVLRGEEFNSIMENGYGLAEALAKGLGVTTGELRKMAENGELSAERVITAVQSQASEVQKTYDQFPTTIGNALQRITTSWEILIGKMDQSNGASATVAQWLVTLADNIADLDVVLNDIGEGFVWVGDQLKKIDPATIEALKTALESAYATLKTIASTLGETFEVTMGVLNTSLGFLFDWKSGVDTAQDNTNGFTKALQQLDVVLGTLNDGFTGLTVLINLLAGAAYSAAGAFAYWSSKISFGPAREKAFAEFQELTKISDDYYLRADNLAMGFESKRKKAIEDITKTQEQKNTETVASSKAKLDQLLEHQTTEVGAKKVSEEEKLSAVQSYAEAAIAANKGVMDGVMQADLMTKGYIVTIDQAGKVSVEAGQSAAQAAETAKTKEEALKLAKENVKKADEEYLAYQKQAAIQRALLEKQIEEAKRSGDLNALLSAQTSLSGIDAKEADLAANRDTRIQELNQATTGSGQVAESSYSRASAAANQFGVDLDVSLNRVSKSFNASGTQLTELQGKLTAAGITGRNAATALYQSWEGWLNKAKSQAEIDFAKAKLKEFGEQGKLSTSQVEMGMQAIRQVVQKLPADIDPVTAAFERLGIKTKEQLALAAQSALADFNTIQSSGQATAESLKQAYERTMQAAAASGDQAVIASTQAKAASLGLQVQVDQTGKATVTSMDGLSSSVDRIGRSFDGIKGHARSAGEVMREEARSSTEEWAAALKAMEGKMKASKTGTKAKTGFSVEEIEQRLVEMGYTGNAESKASELFRAAEPGAGGGYYRSASHEWMKNKYGTSMYDNQKALGNGMFVMEQLEKLGSASTSKVMSLGAPAIPKVPTAQNEPSKTVEYKFMSGSKEVSLYGSANDGNAMEALLSEFEMLKRGT